MATNKKLQDTANDALEKLAEIETKEVNKEIKKEPTKVEAVTASPEVDIAGIVAAATTAATTAAMANVDKSTNTAPAVAEFDNLSSVKLKIQDTKRQKVAYAYSKEKKVPVSISPAYRPHLGSTAMVSLNGISVYVPVNGRPYMVNESHAAILFESIAKYDALLLKSERMSDVQSNVESSPGTLKF